MSDLEVQSCLRRSAVMATDVLEQARDTGVVLGQQHEDIKRMVRGIDQVDRRVDKANTDVEKMKSFTGHGLWYRFKHFFSHGCRKYDIEKAIKGPKAPPVEMLPVKASSQAPATAAVGGGGDPAEEALLDEILEKVGDIKALVLEQRTQIADQNRLLDLAAQTARRTELRTKRVMQNMRNVD